jgi:citrate lyase subunit beta / citryl-CoA lyase
MVRSLLFAPANRHDLITKFPRADADRYVIDLEDGTPPGEKDEARARLMLVVAELRSKEIKGEVYVRLNEPGTSFYADDIIAAIATDIDGVVVPKLEDRQQLSPILHLLGNRRGMSTRPIEIMAGIESVKGIARVDELAGAHSCLTSLYFGAEDFIADIAGRRTAEGTEVLFARSKAVLAAKLAQIIAIDQIVTDLGDEDQFRRDAFLARDLGYNGKMCLTPRQVSMSNEIFSPSDSEIEYATQLIAAYEKAAAVGMGTLNFRGKFVDAPVLKKARSVLSLANKYRK